MVRFLFLQMLLQEKVEALREEADEIAGVDKTEGGQQGAR